MFGRVGDSALPEVKGIGDVEVRMDRRELI